MTRHVRPVPRDGIDRSAIALCRPLHLVETAPPARPPELATQEGRHLLLPCIPTDPATPHLAARNPLPARLANR